MIAYLDCVGGIAGDMMCAALLDAGAPEQALREVPVRLGLPDVELRVERTERHGIAALHLDVLDPHEGHHDRSWRVIRSQLADADLEASVRERAWRCSGASPRWRAPCTGWTSTTSISTRSAPSTR